MDIHDEMVEVDSPETEVVDHLEDQEVGDEPLTISSTTSKLPKSVEKPRDQQLDYKNALPYATESLEEMDVK